MVLKNKVCCLTQGVYNFLPLAAPKAPLYPTMGQGPPYPPAKALQYLVV